MPGRCSPARTMWVVGMGEGYTGARHGVQARPRRGSAAALAACDEIVAVVPAFLGCAGESAAGGAAATFGPPDELPVGPAPAFRACADANAARRSAARALRVAVVPGGRLGSACVSGSLARGRGRAPGRGRRAAALRGFSLRLDAGGQEDGDGQQNRRVAYPCQAGLWHTASMLLPSASSTKAP